MTRTEHCESSYANDDRQPRDVGPGQSILRGLFRVMRTARCVDEAESEMVRAGEAFFHVSGAGHEGSAVLDYFLTPDDWLHCHYRDKALLLARGVSPEMFFHSLRCNAASHSAGRQMSAHLSDPERRVLSIVGPMGNNALQAAGVAVAVKDQPSRPIVLCSLGDGTAQQGEVMEAIAEAVRSELPVLFWIEDNHLSISTRTDGKTFYALPNGPVAEFYGVPIHRLNGREVAQAFGPLGQLIQQMRHTRKPAIVVFDVERLCSHTNADDQRVYRDAAEIGEASRRGDPVRRLADHLLATGCSRESLEAIDGEVRRHVQAAAISASQVGAPVPCRDAKKSIPARLESSSSEYLGDSSQPRLTMLEAIRTVLNRRLQSDRRVILFGEDIEDPKGDVFGVTRGLSTAFPDRVANSPLSESSIVGMSIGRALAGQRPVAFIQFADFLPLALNQILSELGSMHWRTCGGWQVPVIVMAACGGYRPGLGPFHAQTLESMLARVPGIDVFMPSTADAAAGLLNAAFESERPTLFLYPKVCLNDRDRTTSPDVERQLVPIGKSRRITCGNDLTIVSWGSTMPLCEQAVEVLDEAGYGIDLIDLRCISPWDQTAVAASVGRTGRLLVVHEDNRTCGFGAEVVSAVIESLDTGITARRIARPDTYVPCNYMNQLDLLPGRDTILEAAAEMMGVWLSWDDRSGHAQEDGDWIIVSAQGASPADQAMTVIDWLVAPGEKIDRGQPLAEAEADKSVLQLTSPAAGTIEQLLVAEGEQVRIGAPVLRLLPDAEEIQPHCATKSAIPRMQRRPQSVRQVPGELPSELCVGLSVPRVVEASRTITNDQLAESFPGMSADDIFQRTGIATRRWADECETTLSMAIEAAESALAAEGCGLDELGCIICSTGTPDEVTPSMACRVLKSLSSDRQPPEIPALDINAACSGYLHALALAHDFLRHTPLQAGLVVTSETLSRLLDPADFSSVILFGDAASATIVYGTQVAKRGRWQVRRPLLGSCAEDGSTLSVPLIGGGSIRMQGRNVFSLAVRSMDQVLRRACKQAGWKVEGLDMVIPHQANGRILDAVATRVRGPRVFNNIRHCGNTSSSTIPQCLAELADRDDPAERIGLCAFGGGFTFGAALMTGHLHQGD